MNTTVARESWTWSPDVLAYADKYRLRPYLDELLSATRKLFPTSRSLEVFTEMDAEDPTLEYLVFEVHVPERDVPDFLASDRAWRSAYYRLVPGPYSAAVCFSLHRDPE